MVNTVIYVSGEMGPSTIADHISDFQGSGVNTVVFWALHIGRPSIAGQNWGDLIFNQQPYTLVSVGKYNTDYGDYPGQVAQLKQSSSVTKIFFSVGGANPPVEDFTSIGTIITDYGLGPGSPLYDNFSALRTAFTFDGTCVIDGIDLDCEEDVSNDVLVQFSQMLFGLGFEVTFCPYAGAGEVWTPVMQTLWNAGQQVSWWNLQCYAGGVGNYDDLKSWISELASVVGNESAASYLVPGLAVYGSEYDGRCPSNNLTDFNGVEESFAMWTSLGLGGGFLWNYGNILSNAGATQCTGSTDLAAYVSAIETGLGS